MTRHLSALWLSGVIAVSLALSAASATGATSPIPVSLADAQVGDVVELNVDTDPQLERFTLLPAADGAGAQWTLQDGATTPSMVGPQADQFAAPVVFDANEDGRPEFLTVGGGGNLGLHFFEVWQWDGTSARRVWMWDDGRALRAGRGVTVYVRRFFVSPSQQSLIVESGTASGCRGCPEDFRLRERFTYRAASDDWQFARLDRWPSYRAGRRTCRDVRLGPVQFITEVRSTGMTCFAARMILNKADLIRNGRRQWKSDGVAWRFRFEDEVSGRLSGVRGPQRVSGLRVTT